MARLTPCPESDPDIRASLPVRQINVKQVGLSAQFQRAAERCGSVRGAQTTPRRRGDRANLIKTGHFFARKPHPGSGRSEERRVGKEWRSGVAAEQQGHKEL